MKNRRLAANSPLFTPNRFASSRRSPEWLRLWAELHVVPRPISHPIPRLARCPFRPAAGSALDRLRRLCRPTFLGGVLLLASTAGCTVLSYTGPNGERFSRSSVGTSLALASLVVESGTNGLRRVELQGYQNDAAQALGTVTEAAVRAALQGAK